jgi:hypothetical protein
VRELAWLPVLQPPALYSGTGESIIRSWTLVLRKCTSDAWLEGAPDA